LFERKGVFVVENRGDFDLEEFELEMIDSGAEEFEENENLILITTAMEDFGNVAKKMEEMGIEPDSQELQRIPHDTTKLSIEDSKKVLRLVEKLEDDDDVQKVYHNLEISEELEKEL
jgi:transcriptional/translational regulatory protein YebC/TACO1